jgi:bifunctional DNase/RNase
VPKPEASTAEAPALANRAPAAPPRRVDPLEKVAAGYVLMQARGVARDFNGAVVTLIDEDETAAVPIFIGNTEALSIALRYEGKPFSRPLTHDLLDNMLERFGAQLVRIQVDKIENNVFHGSVYVFFGDRIHQFDARPSDAIALAIGNRKPIYVHQSVIDAAALKGEELTRLLERMQEDQLGEDSAAP